MQMNIAYTKKRHKTKEANYAKTLKHKAKTMNFGTYLSSEKIYQSIKKSLQ